MKNFIYIALLSIGLFATSCSKEEVIMNNTNQEAVPAWDNSSFEKKGMSTADNNGSTSSAGDSGASQTGGTTTGGTASDGDITDPNNDPDGKKKKL